MDINQIILNFLKNNKRYLLVYFILMSAYPISTTSLPRAYSKFIDDLKNNNGLNMKTLIFYLCLTNFLFFMLDKVDTYFIPKLQSYIRTTIIKNIFEHYKDKHQEQDLGNIISKLIKLPLIIREIVSQIRNTVIPIFLICISAVYKFLTIHKRLGVITFLSFSVLGIITYTLSLNVLKLYVNMDKNTDDIHENITDILDNLIDVYTMNTSDKEIADLEKHQQNINNEYSNTFSKSNDIRNLINICSVFLFIFSVSYSYNLYKDKSITLDNLLDVIITGKYVVSKLSNFATSIPELLFNISIYNNTQKYFKHINIKEEYTNFHTIINNDILFNNVSISYGDKEVIKNLNIYIPQNSSISIVGSIGCGKSSIVKSLLKLLPYKGDIYIGNVNTQNISTTHIRNNILYVRQNPIPLNRTLYQNIIYGNPDISIDTVDEIFRKHNLYSFFNNFPLDKYVGKKGSNLSGGQRQMIFLLRILLSNHSIIILDEPTSSLDIHSAKRISKLIKEFTKGKTLILITHDDKLGQITDNTIKI